MAAHPLQHLIDRPIPDLALPASDGTEFQFRQFVEQRPLVLFFYLRNGTPGWVRELREFRDLHPQFVEADLALAGVSADTLESHARWTERLHIPFPLLSDPERKAGRALELVRRIGVGPWSVELFRRATLLIDAHGVISAAWTEGARRGHAQQVLEAARVLKRMDRPT